MTLLIDTGAAISVLRKDKIGNNPLDVLNIVSIVGVASKDSPIRSYGTAEISLDNYRKHKFHVADLNIEADGILGLDFMSKSGVNIYIAIESINVITDYSTSEKKINALVKINNSYDRGQKLS